jgi:hypothetical protein
MKGIKMKEKFMNKRLKIFILITSIIGSFFSPQATAAGSLVGEWNFNNSSNRLQASVGTVDLTLGGNQDISDVTGTGGGDGAIRVKAGTYLEFATGDHTAYSMVFDILRPITSVGQWMPFFDTGVYSNAASCYISDNEQIGLGKYSSYTIPHDTWVRIVITVESDSHYLVYADGVLINDQVNDSNFAIKAAEGLFLFHENGGYDSNIHVSDLQFYDGVLSDTEVLNLGGVPLGSQAKDDLIFTDLNTPVTFSVLADNGNGVDNNPNAAVVNLSTYSTDGTLVQDSNDTDKFTYTPATGEIGTTSFQYTLDGETATVYITVVPPTVSVNLNDGTSNKVVAATESAGVVLTKNWNNVKRDVNTAALNNNAGNQTQVGITWDYSYAYSKKAYTGYGSTGSDTMMNSIVWGCKARQKKKVFTISGLNDFTGTTTCDIYVYFGGEWTDKISLRDVTTGGSGQDFECYRGNGGYGPFREQFAAESFVGAGNNYVVFRNISTDTFGIEIQSYTGNWANINGFQVVKNTTITKTRPAELSYISDGRKIEWTGQDPTTGYEVKVFDANDFSTQVGPTLTIDPAVREASVSSLGLSHAKRYFYQIDAISGNSKVSSRSSFVYSYKGLVFDYRLDEEPNTVQVVDSTGNCSVSNILPSSVKLTGGSGSSGDSSLDYTAEITKGDEYIAIRNMGLVFDQGATMVCWVKPKVGEATGSWAGLMYSRFGSTDCGLSIGKISDSATVGTPVEAKFCWNVRYEDSAPNAKIKVGMWNFVALSVDPISGNLKIYTGDETEDDLTVDEFTNNAYKGTVDIDSFKFGCDYGSNRTFFGYMRDIRMYGSVLPHTASSELSLEELFDAEKSNVSTPVIGLELVQNGSELTWTLEEQVEVIEYQIVDVATDEVIQTIASTDAESYTVTLPEGVKAELVVIDKHGPQTYLPINDDVVTTPYNLEKGWNLIAITGNHANLSELQKVAIGPFWAWNGSTYERTTTPTATQAIWVHSKIKTRVNVTAEKSAKTITLTPGWSLVGPTNNVEVPKDALSVFSYNKMYNAISASDNVLVRGVGYWIFSL